MGADFLAELRAAGFCVRTDGRQLFVSPRSELDDHQRESIRDCRDELISALVEEDGLAGALVSAIDRACDLRGDDDANRAGLKAECLALSFAGMADMLDHFRLEARRYEAARRPEVRGEGTGDRP